MVRRACTKRARPLAPNWVYESGLPVLGICYGMQVMAHQLGGRVAASTKREYGHAVLAPELNARCAFCRLAAFHARLDESR